MSGNNKKLYKYAGKFDDQQQYRSILKSATASTPQGFTDNSLMSTIQSVTVKNAIARKSLRHFLYILEVKPKTAVIRFCAAKSNCKAIIADSILWCSITKRWGYS